MKQTKKQSNKCTSKHLIEKDKEIAELKKSNLELLDFYEKKLNKVTELEAQIEKMKNCYNCNGKLCERCCRKNKKSKKDCWSLSQYLEN